MHQAEIETPYQVLNHRGQLAAKLPVGLEEVAMLRWYRAMWLTRYLSNKLIALQRQGRATTWLSSQGQEAAAVGLATTLRPQDWLAASPREMGGYLLKGVTPAAITYFTRGYTPPPDLYHGDPRCLPFTIVIGTQALHSVGLAMAARIKGVDEVVVGSCGDGATSEGDFQEAMNFAGVFKAPVVLVVVNNGWAISVPSRRQTAARRIALRGAGFGLPARVVDGNDILAMFGVMSEATERAQAGGGPTLVEAITYRIGAHSTADDPTRYCPPEELAYWKERDPLARFRRFLLDQTILNEATDCELAANAEAEINRQAQLAFDYPTPAPDSLFDHVYSQPTPRLKRQRRQLQIEM